MRIRMRKNIGYPFVLLEENPSITNIEETTTKYGTKKLNVKTNLESEDLLYSFDGGTTWQKEPYKTFIKTTEAKVLVSDIVGNKSGLQTRFVNVDHTFIDLSANEDGSIIGEIENGDKLIIQGEGKMKDIAWSGNEKTEIWENMGINKNDIKTIEIKEGVVSIGNCIFYQFANLTTVILPNSLKEIGEHAFHNCSRISSINIPENIEKIGAYSLYNSSRIDRIYINSKTKIIGTYALYSIRNIYYNSNNILIEKYKKQGVSANNSFKIDDIAPELTNIQITGNKITINALDKGGTEDNIIDDCSGIDSYSFDGGKTWQKSNEYIGKIDDVNLVIKDKVHNEKECLILKEIEIANGPSKTNYIEGQNFEKNGLKVNAIYTNGNIKEITNYTIINGNNLKTSIKSLTIKYEENGITKEANQAITVIPKVVTEITIKENPKKMNYFEGDTIDLTGLILQVKYNDESEIIVTKGYSANIETLETIGNQDIEITFENKTIILTVIVEERKLNIDLKEYTEEKDGETSFLTEISQNTKVSELEIETNGNIEIQKGEMQLKEGDLMGTGCVLKITIGKEIKEYTLVITGDLTGDGLSDDRDLLKMARYGVGLDKNLKGAYLKAANVVKDNSPADDRDLLKMSRALVGLDSL